MDSCGSDLALMKVHPQLSHPSHSLEMFKTNCWTRQRRRCPLVNCFLRKVCVLWGDLCCIGDVVLPLCHGSGHQRNCHSLLYLIGCILLYIGKYSMDAPVSNAALLFLKMEFNIAEQSVTISSLAKESKQLIIIVDNQAHMIVYTWRHIRPNVTHCIILWQGKWPSKTVSLGWKSCACCDEVRKVWWVSVYIKNNVWATRRPSFAS